MVLKESCGRAYPAGTKIRELFCGPPYLFAAAANQVVLMVWTQSSGCVYGMATEGAGNARWWPGAKYARVVILLNCGQDDSHAVLVSAVSVTPQTP